MSKICFIEFTQHSQTHSFAFDLSQKVHTFRICVRVCSIEDPHGDFEGTEILEQIRIATLWL